MTTTRYFAVCLLGLSVGLSSQAQSSHTVEHAQRCAGIATVMAQTHANDKEASDQLLRDQALFDELYARENHATADAPAIHLSLQQDIQNERSTRARELIEEGVLCGAWAQSMWSQGDHYKYITVFPKVIAPASRERYQPWSQRTFGQSPQ
jgi:hypothetical protein